MTNDEIEKMAREDHYVSQLVFGKQCFGLDYRVGFVFEKGTKRFGTIKEMADHGICDQRFAVIDDHIQNLLVIGSEKWREAEKLKREG